jgi:hypothetical protein
MEPARRFRHESLQGAEKRGLVSVGGSARRGQHGGTTRTTLPIMVDGSGNVTSLAGWRASDLTLRELPPQGKVQKRIVRLAARGNAGSGCLPAEAPPTGVDSAPAGANL